MGHWINKKLFTAIVLRSRKGVLLMHGDELFKVSTMWEY